MATTGQPGDATVETALTTTHKWTITTAAGTLKTATTALLTSYLKALWQNTSGNFAGLSGFKLSLVNDAGTFTSTLANTATAARAWLMPDKSGTVAMTSDIPNFPMGEVAYFNVTGTSVTISGTSDGSTNMVKVAPTTTGDFMTETDNGGADDGRLRYTGATTKCFHIAVTVSGTPQTSNDVFVIGVAKNGTVYAPSKVLGSASGTQFSALHAMITLATNDYIELYIGNVTAGRNMTIKSLNLFMMGV